MESQRRNRIEIALHVIWTTYRREKRITPEIERIVYRVAESEAQKLNCTILAIGGVADHVHVVLLLPSTTTLASLMKQMKGVSSSAVRDFLGSGGYFRWADGYVAFSLSRPHRNAAVAYVQRQKQHHGEGSLWPSWEECPDELTLPSVSSPTQTSASRGEAPECRSAT